MQKILIVEDNQELSRMYARVFRLSGYEAELAFDGKEAIEKVTRTPEKPILILLDVLIPNVSGLDVLRTIKQDESLKQIPVIILTNSFKKENADLFLSLGASLYLVKMENDPKHIIQKVNQLLQAANSKAALK